MECSVMSETVSPDKDYLTRSYLGFQVALGNHILLGIIRVVGNITTCHLYRTCRTVVYLDPCSSVSERIDIIIHIIGKYLVDTQGRCRLCRYTDNRAASKQQQPYFSYIHFLWI